MSGFNFGTSNTGGTGFSFGTPAATGTTAPQTGFGFGTNPGTTSAATTGFSFGGGATSTANTGSTGFSFGNTAATTANTGTTAFGTFGSTAPASSATGTGFSFGGATQAAKPFGFGTTATTSSSGFGLLGAKPATGFGFGATDASQQQQQQQQQQGVGQPDASLALHLAICTPSYFNNENDDVLRKWNQLQAFWGAGKGYYAPNMPPVEFTPENPYCRFKVVCYAKIPECRNEDGHVQLTIGKPLPEVEPHKQQIISTLSTMFGGAEVVVDEVYAAKVQGQTLMQIHVLQPLPGGGKQRASSTDVFRHMGAANNAQTIKNLCIQEVIPIVALTEKQLKEYLDTPQRGIDPALWEQGKRENPDPKKFIPVVRIGFQEIQHQFKQQEQQAERLQGELKDIGESIGQLRHKQQMVKAAIQNAKWKQANLTRRILKLVSWQEVERKRGVPLDQTEEQIRMRVEDLYVQLMQPTQYRGCLNELMAQMSVKPSGSGGGRGGARYGLVGEREKELQQYISWQHSALQAVVDIVKEDLSIADAMAQEMMRKS